MYNEVADLLFPCCLDFPLWLFGGLVTRVVDASRATCSSMAGMGLLTKLTTSIGGLSENATADKSVRDLNGDLLRAWKNRHSI